jgi:hypothetical protein
MTTEAKAPDAIENQGSGDCTSQAPPWARASIADLADLDFEGPVRESQSADSTELGDLFRRAAGAVGEDRELPDTPSARVFNMLAAVAGMLFKSQEPNEPFGAMAVFADGRRSAVLSDFRGEATEVLAEMAALAKHPVLRARLADTSWLLDRKKGQLAATAAEAYVEIVRKVDSGALKFRFDKDHGALKFEARDLLRRALLIGRATGLDKAGPSAARKTVADLRKRSLEKLLPVPALWFGHLDLDFSISEPAEVGQGVEALIDMTGFRPRPMATRRLTSGGWPRAPIISPKGTTTGIAVRLPPPNSSYPWPNSPRRCWLHICWPRPLPSFTAFPARKTGARNCGIDWSMFRPESPRRCRRFHIQSISKNSSSASNSKCSIRACGTGSLSLRRSPAPPIPRN